MRVEPSRLPEPELALLLALVQRRLGQVWRRAEQDTPGSWLQYAERIWPELLPEGVRATGIGRVAQGLAGADPARTDLTGHQAVVAWADALAAGFALTPGAALPLETAEAATAPLPAGFPGIEPGGVTAREPLFWSLSPRSEQPLPLPADKLLKPDPADPGNIYRRIHERAASALAQLPPDPIGLLRGLRGVLREIDHVPVALANGRVAGMADHIGAAVSLAAALHRGPGVRPDQSPGEWMAADQPWWLAVGLSLRSLAAPRTVDEQAAVVARQQAALAGVLEALASALGRDSLEAAMVGEPGAGDVLLLLEAVAAGPLQSALDAAGPTLREQGLAAGLAGQPLTAADLTGHQARLGAVLEQVLVDARAASDAPAGPFAGLFGPTVPARRIEADPAALAASSAGSSSAEAPAIARPTLAVASPRADGEDEDGEPADDDQRGSDAPPGALVVPPDGAALVCVRTAARATPLPVPPIAGAVPTEVTAWVRRAADASTHASRVLAVAPVVAIAATGEWHLRASLSVLPGLVARAVEHWSSVWGNCPPLPVFAAVAGGLAASPAPEADTAADPAPASAALVATRTALGLAIRAAQTVLPGMARTHGAAAVFPRHTDDLRACLPIADLPVLQRLGLHVLNLSGLRLDEASAGVQRVGRSHDWVAARCRRAAQTAFPERRGGWPAQPVRDGRWRMHLTYSLNRYLGRRRPWSRKKKPAPTPVDQLVDAIDGNRWPGLDRPTCMDAALVLDLASRWVDALRPPATTS